MKKSEIKKVVKAYLRMNRKEDSEICFNSVLGTSVTLNPCEIHDKSEIIGMVESINRMMNFDAVIVVSGKEEEVVFYTDFAAEALEEIAESDPEQCLRCLSWDGSCTA